MSDQAGRMGGVSLSRDYPPGNLEPVYCPSPGEVAERLKALPC